MQILNFWFIWKKLLSSQAIHFLNTMARNSCINGDERLEVLKKRDSIEDYCFLRVRDKYRLHLVREFRSIFEVDVGTNLLFVKEPIVSCPHCNKPIRLPGNRMIPINNEDVTIICQDVEAPVKATMRVLS